MRHRLSDHPAKDFFPARKLAHDVERMEDAFAKRIVNQAGESDVIRKAQGGSVAHVLLALGAIAGEHKLHVVSARTYQPRHFEKVTDSFFRNYPTDLSNYCSVRRDRKPLAEPRAGAVL